MLNSKGWVGIDLDGTLAVYDKWRGPTHIGAPIPDMVDYVKGLLLAGVEVRIFTARCQEGEKAITAIELWCKVHIGVVLPVTDRKDFKMVFAVDDRAISVEKNTGKFLVQPFSISTIRRHTATDNPEAPEYTGQAI